MDGQPNNLDAEQSVLGAMLFSPDALVRALDLLQGEDFYHDAHRQIFNALADLAATNTPADLITLTDALRLKGLLKDIGGAVYLSQLSVITPTATNMEHHARLVEESATKRAMDRIGRLWQEQAATTERPEILVRRAKRQIEEIENRTGRVNFRSLHDVMIQIHTETKERGKRDGEITGIPSGLAELDALTIGWQPGDLIIIAARPGMGKTAFALNMAREAVKQGTGVAFFSLEMSCEMLGMRLWSLESGVNLKWIRSGHLTAQSWPKLTKAYDILAQLPIFFDDTAQLTVSQIRGRTRRLRLDKPIGMVVVDYIQLAKGNGEESRRLEVDAVGRGLKALAKELNIPVMALSQLSRETEKRQSRRPQLSDLRESGSLEQDADLVGLLYRPDYYNRASQEPALLMLEKQRNGETGEIPLDFDRETGKFSSLSQGDVDSLWLG